jgi:cytochrome c
VVLALAGAPVLAQDAVTPDVSLFSGNAEAGLEAFNRQCAACHVVINDAGETLAGRNAKTGPNQWNLAYNLIGHEEDFDYSDAIMQLHEAGERWTEDKFVAYVQDPTGWLREATGDRRARGKMSFQLRDEEAAHDLWAYFVSISPELTEDAAAAYTEDTATE